MNCPVCDDVLLKEIERGSVMIDVCSNCKGIWLDRGELEKIIQGLKDDKTSTLSYKQNNGKKHSTAEKKSTMLDVLGEVLFFL